MTHKKFLLTIFIICCLSACTNNHKALNDTNLNTIQETNEEGGTSYFTWDDTRIESAEVSWEKLLTFEEVVSGSPNIVVATALGKEAKGYYKFTFNVDQVLKGQVETEYIHVYENVPFFTQDKTYVLYLDKSKSPYYDHIVYNTLFDTFHKIEGSDLVMFKSPDKSCTTDLKTLEALKTYIAGVADTSNYHHDAAVVHTDSDNLLEIFDISAFILEIKTLEAIIVGENAVFMKCQVTKTYRGQIEDELNIFLPSNAEVGETYLVTLNKTESSYMISSKNGFIKLESDRYQEAVKMLNDE